MQGPETLYFLMDAEGRSFYVEDGIVKTSAMPKPLEFTPNGWQDIIIENARNVNYFLLDRSLTLPLEFVEDGARILKDSYYRYGIETHVELVIAKQQLEINETHYGFYYTLLFKGELDFAMFSHEGPKVVINVKEGGVIKYLQAYHNMKVEIPMSELNTDLVQIDGLLLKQSAKYIITNGYLPNDNGNHSVAVMLAGQEGIKLNTKSVDRVQLGDNPNQKLFDDQLWFYKASNNEPIKVSWDLKMTAQLASGIPPNPEVRLWFSIRMMKPGSSFVYRTIHLEEKISPVNVYNVHTFKGEKNIDGFEEGDTLYLFMGINIVGQSADRAVFFTYDNNYNNVFNITEANYKHPTTYIKAVKPIDLFKKIVEKITDGKYIPASNFLESIPSIKITSGDAIRGLEEAKIITTLSDFFKSMNTLYGVGMGVMDGVLRMERKKDVVHYSNVIDLGSAKKLRIKPTESLLYSHLEIGYAKQEYDEVNGRQEFNNTHVYRFPNTRVGKTLNLVSPYRADSYGIEMIRINTEGKDSTDKKDDTNIFFVHTENESVSEIINGEVMTYYRINRSLNEYATGIADKSVFNLFLSPKQCLLRNGAYIRSLFYKQDNEAIRYQTTDKNSELTVSVPGQPVIKENADIEISRLEPRLFIPVLLEFETLVPNNLFQQLAANPLSAFSFNWNGLTYTGIPEKVAMNPEKNDSQLYQLYAAPDTDLTPLIDSFE